MLLMLTFECILKLKYLYGDGGSLFICRLKFKQIRKMMFTFNEVDFPINLFYIRKRI